ncbi:hypothetical protein [Nitrososphaera sp.]|uniref:hypothetical protein n=1 Tax=Nitrososphaera sp. TaxID=1971748 RepID=UPI0017A41774|nr:hypothetical protein [Nitrososphaera sp.]NWG36890.1 hypothetical protein [Nitrososphaera sp.]
MQTTAFDPQVIRRWLTVTLAVALVALNLPLILADGEGRVFFGNWILNATSAGAFALAAVVALRQGKSGLYGKAQAAFALALGLWLAGELLWTYYELGLGIDNPFPSLADAAWLAGYAPAAYYLFRIYRFFGAGQNRLALAVSVATAAFVAYSAIELVLVSADPEGDALSLVVSLLYVAVDGLLIVPAVLVLLRLKSGKLTGVPWFLLSISMLLFAAADLGFAYHSAIGAPENDWVWDPLYNAAYIMMAATLFWHNRFFIYDRDAARKTWQQENR